MRRLRWQQVKKKKKSIAVGASRPDLTSDQSVTRARVVNLTTSHAITLKRIGLPLF